MDYKKIVNKYMDDYGCTVEYSKDGVSFTPPYKAFIQPLRYKNKMYLDGKHSEIGYIDNSYYLYLGPTNVDVRDNINFSRLKFKNNLYNFTHAENIRIGEDTMYIWAIIRRSFNN